MDPGPPVVVTAVIILLALVSGGAGLPGVLGLLPPKAFLLSEGVVVWLWLGGCSCCSALALVVCSFSLGGLLPGSLPAKTFPPSRCLAVPLLLLCFCENLGDHLVGGLVLFRSLCCCKGVSILLDLKPLPEEV